MKKLLREVTYLAVAAALAIFTASSVTAAEEGDWLLDPDSCIEHDDHFWDGSWHHCDLVGTSGGGSTCQYVCDDIPATVYKYTSQH